VETSEEVLTIRPAAWGEDAAVALAPALSFPGDLEAVADQVMAGAASLFEVVAGDVVVCRYVLRVDGSEGVMVAASGRWKGGDMTAAVMPFIEKQFSGVNAIRIHTSRAGAVRKLAALGYGAAEMVLRKVVNNGR
jgi:hypothetical protein